MSWLVTGGAGYVGAHVVRAFTDVGVPAVVLDDLSSGHRDFVRADVVAARRLATGDELRPIYNLGSGTGSSVRQIMDAIRSVTGIDFTPVIAPRRAGDPARIVASGELAERDLGWQMRHTLEQMVASDWQARQVARV